MAPDSLPRIGLGWDRHGLVVNRPCLLGGIEIPNDTGPIGHSDADVLLHALCDALLGAAGLEDLGTLFPDDDPKWKGSSSTRFLEEAMSLLRKRDLRVASTDLVVICDTPKLRPHRQAIRENLAMLLDLPLDRVNLKGKTTEGGCSGSIEVQAVVLLVGA
ncbi:MAG: 2-C-methyl-D-erythritol 2,4-cyclodiphosphate synthase [Planctomycetota bacterium]|jgi:2-C-methyl-D-erythritol 2,4-cyclodiphosphate synthase